jgi:hypothetical protein
MSEDKKPSVFEMQMEINKLTNERIDLQLKFNKEVLETVKTISARLVALEQEGCACKKGEM